MSTPPSGWPRISSSVFYQEAAAAIDWLCEAFGFQVEIKVEGEDGAILHSQLSLPDRGLVMVGQVGLSPTRTWCKSPAQLSGACTQALVVVVDDADAHCEHARSRGAVIATEPETQDYGPEYWVDRTYEAIDCEGHHWWFLQRIETNTKAGAD